MNSPPCAQSVESPCIRVCILDAGNVCTGCGRSLEEIAAWSRLSTEEQRLVRARAAERLIKTPVCIPTGG